MKESIGDIVRKGGVKSGDWVGRKAGRGTSLMDEPLKDLTIHNNLCQIHLHSRQNSLYILQVENEQIPSDCWMKVLENEVSIKIKTQQDKDKNVAMIKCNFLFQEFFH